MKLPRLALCVLAASVAACAVFGPDAEVQVVLPSPPEHWRAAFAGLGFRIVVPRGQSMRAERDAAGGESPVAITLDKITNAPVLAYPFDQGGAGAGAGVPGLLRPAGGFYPYSLRRRDGEEVLALTWEDGAAALVVARLLDRGYDVSLFNVERLSRYLREAEDPWSWDLEAIAEKIARGDFTAWDVDELPRRDAAVSPGPGTWFLESPFALPLAALEGWIVLPGVTWGDHCLFSLGGESCRLSVGERDVVLVKQAASRRQENPEDYGVLMIFAAVRTRAPFSVISTSFSHRTPP